jgi:transcriptional regulator with XRE-family HTH domain
MQCLGYNARLKKKLVEQGITQSQLAKKADLPIAYISDLMRGKRNLSRQKLALIAEILHSSTEQLFGGNPNADW